MKTKRVASKFAKALAGALLVAGLLPAAAFAGTSGDLAAGGLDVDGAVLSAQALAGDGSKAVQAAAKGQEALAVFSDGSVWKLGADPAKVFDGAVQVSESGSHYGAVKADGSLWMWGDNSYGQLGDGTKTNRSVPVKVMDGVSQIVADGHVTAALRQDGSLWMWGNGTATPTRVMDGVSQVAMRGYYYSTCAVVKTNGELWTWRFDNTFQAKNPEKLMGGIAQVSLDVWGSNFAAVGVNGALYTWGLSTIGILGDGSQAARENPMKILDGVVSAELGLTHGAAITADGSLYTWGCNERGQLGNGTVANQYSPVKVMDGVAQVSAGGQAYNILGSSFTVAVKKDGSLWSWGSNTAGQLGDGTTEDKASPICLFRSGEWLSGDDAYHFADEVPEREALQKFLSPLFWYGNGNEASVGNREYDSEKATQYSNNVIANLIWHPGVSIASLTDGTYPVDVFIGSGSGYSDPFGKFSEYRVCDGNAVEWVARNIFNVSAKDCLSLREAGDNPSWAKYYYRDGKYYAQTGGIGTGASDVAVLSATRDGNRFDVYFRIRYGYDTIANWDAGKTQSDSTYLYAQVGLKEVDGQDYWTLYKLSEYPLDPAIATMHRLYNPNSGEHFYTADHGEFANLVALGWRDEGTGWTAPATSGTPVFRMYNARGGEHHYCTDAGERDALVAAGWAYEGIGWYSDDSKSVPLYREYNPNAFANNHNYTTDKEEHEWLLSLGWKDEGYAWYGVK